MTPSTEIVGRLRAASRSYDRFTYGSVLLDAATEIERLAQRVADLEASAPLECPLP
jgi:hypothetical protein